jgi:hypothetical protein
MDLAVLKRAAGVSDNQTQGNRLRHNYYKRGYMQNAARSMNSKCKRSSVGSCSDIIIIAVGLARTPKMRAGEANPSFPLICAVQERPARAQALPSERPAPPGVHPIPHPRLSFLALEAAVAP